MVGLSYEVVEWFRLCSEVVEWLRLCYEVVNGLCCVMRL